MKIKTWTREGEKTKDAQFSTGSAYTDGIKMNKVKYHGRNLTS